MHTTDPQKTLGAALGRIPSGVFVLTVSKGDVETGMLASWIQQCAFTPPMVSIAIQSGRPVGGLLQNGAVFTLNLLEAAQTDMIAHFGKGFALKDDAFNGLAVQRVPPHGPILQEALGYLFGTVQTRLSTGDHDLLLVEVTAGTLLDEGQPMVHVHKNGFHY